MLPYGVPFRGPRNAKILLLGEAPGKQEMQENKPFVGASGQMLERVARMVQYPVDQIAYGNVYPVMPDNPRGKFWTGKQRDQKLREAADYVRYYLDLYRDLRVIVCVGGVSLRAVTGYNYLYDAPKHEGYAGAIIPTELRNPLYDWPEHLRDCTYGAVVHPSGILRSKDQAYFGWLAVHLQRYFNIALGAESPVPKMPDIVNDPTGLEALDVLTCSRGPVVYDTEYHTTPPHEYEPYLMSFARPGDTRIYSMPVNSATRDAVQQIVNHADPLIAHNINADLRALETQGITVPESTPLYDTMIVSKILQCDLPVSLGACARFWTVTYPWKNMRGEVFNEQLYNALDTLRTGEIYLGQKIDTKLPTTQALIDRQMEIVPKIGHLQREGMRLDIPKLNRMRRQHERNLQRYELYIRQAVRRNLRGTSTGGVGQIDQAIRAAEDNLEQLRLSACEARLCNCRTKLSVRPKKCPECISAFESTFQRREELRSELAELKKLRIKEQNFEDFNPASSHSVRRLVYEVWKLKLPGRRRKTASGARTVDEHELQDMIDEVCDNEQARILRAIISYRQVSKALSTFLGWDIKKGTESAKYPRKRDHLYPDIKMHGTWSGRPSSGTERSVDSDPDDYDVSSFNAFNIPKRYRVLFIPRDGYVFVGGDYSDLEGRMVCLESGDKQLAEWYNSGRRVHSERGHLAFPHVEPQDAKTTVGISRGKYEYTVDFMGKKLGHGTHYGMRPDKAASELRIPKEEAQRVYHAIFAKHPHILRWQQSVITAIWGESYHDYATSRRMYRVYPSRRQVTAFGRIKYYYGRQKDQQNEALAQCPQSHGSEVWYETFHKITRPRSSNLVLPWEGRVVTGTYDSFLCEIRKDQADDFEKWLADIASQEIVQLRTRPGAVLMRPCFPFATAQGMNYKAID